MLSVDRKVMGIAIEHRNPINQSADFVVWKEGKRNAGSRRPEKY